jgi:ketosteroid isomerase-like protein
MRTPREVSESYWEAECARDLEGVVSHYHADGVHQSPGIVARGHDEIRRMFGENMTEYPGLEVTIVKEFPLGDSSAIEFDAFLIDHDGRRHRVRGVNVVQVRDGRFVSVRSYEDAPVPE